MERSGSQELTALRVAWDAWRATAVARTLSRPGRRRGWRRWCGTRAWPPGSTPITIERCHGIDRPGSVLPPAAGHQTGADGALR